MRGLVQVLLPGGIAEMFKNRKGIDVLYLRKRHASTRLAIILGASIVPTYQFGNAACMRHVPLGPVERISRKCVVCLQQH